MSKKEPTVWHDEGDAAQFIAPATRTKIEKRCAKAGIPFENHTGGDDGDYVSCALGNGRDRRRVFIENERNARRFLRIPFENYSFVGTYNAMCCYPDKFIEAEVSARGTFDRIFGLISAGRDNPVREEAADQRMEILRDVRNDSERIALVKVSKELRILSNDFYSLSNRMAIRIESVDIQTHEQALSILECLANSLFFQIDIIYGIPLRLARKPRLRLVSKHRSQELADLRFPQRQYDKAAMDLYWYGRRAAGMPLLQYLAFYQVIEYHFPAYARLDAKRRIRQVLSSPDFRVDRDTDIAKILTQVAPLSSGYGEEKAQLKATIRECVDPKLLYEYMEEDAKRKEFLSKKMKGLTDRRIGVIAQNAELCNEVAERVYDIRCRIVHSKSSSQDGDEGPLLPFSSEAELLDYDVDLVMYVARQVLIASGSAISL